MPSPDRVATDDLYGLMQPTAMKERTQEMRQALADAFSDPTEAGGWLGILIPAIVTAVALSVVRRWF